MLAVAKRQVAVSPILAMSGNGSGASKVSRDRSTSKSGQCSFPDAQSSMRLISETRDLKPWKFFVGEIVLLAANQSRCAPRLIKNGMLAHVVANCSDVHSLLVERTYGVFDDLVCVFGSQLLDVVA